MVEYKQGNINKEAVVDIVSETISFMMKFLTISSRDSKDAITLFSSIMNDIYTTNKVSKDLIINTIAAELVKQGVTADKLKFHCLHYMIQRQKTNPVKQKYHMTKHIHC